MPKQRGRVIVVGSSNTDLVVHCDTLPSGGETVLGKDMQTFAGGKGANQAVAAARLGAEVVFAGCVGRDAWGAEMRSRLAAENVDVTDVLARGGEATGVALITIDPAGQNTIIVAPGANMSLSERDVEAVRDDIAQAEALLLQLEVPLAANRRALEIAREASVPVFFNAAPAQRLAPSLLELVDVLIVNESEARCLSGLDDARLGERQIASHLCSMSGGHVVITLGERGALHFDGEALTRQGAFPVKAVDATGAGDAFAAAFAIAWCEGRSVAESLAFACAAGAVAATGMGALASLPNRSQVEALLGGA